MSGQESLQRCDRCLVLCQPGFACESRDEGHVDAGQPCRPAVPTAAREALQAIARVEALAEDWDADLDSGRIRDFSARYCWNTALSELRRALEPTPPTTQPRTPAGSTEEATS